MKQPSDYINDELLDLQIEGGSEKLQLALWELMKQAALIQIKHELRIC